ncbi:ABC transporter permease [uncultured Bacteroides sp.]|uniref:ABC transporter permease n=1 Tax=uncultured Bacteroides sp. TaxID=162156 RepID=UPI002AAAF519|nr:ABC transporter permease [uncultured Bacteroides sp.]
MKFTDIDYWEEILITITRNKTRSMLTAFGIFWGIFMLVALIGGGNGLQQMMSRNFAGFATNSCFIISQQTSEPYKGFRKGRKWDLENNDVATLRSRISDIEDITPNLFRWGASVVRGDKKGTFVAKGVYPSYDKIEKQTMLYGRFINDVDISEQRKVCTIGTRIYETLFKKGQDPCGQYIRVDGIYYQIVGVCSGVSNINIGGSSEEMVNIPFATMQQAYNMGKIVHIICLTAKHGVSITSLEPKIQELIKYNHLISPKDPQAVMVLNMEEMFKMVDSLFSGIRTLVWLVGLGTLLAGAIGVSNIMMVTVRERTVEIGIRRAIGARPREIMQQILSESMVLTAIAGLTGISFAVLILQVAEVGITASGTVAHFQVSFWTAIGMALLLLSLGLFAGLAPAYRAMSIKPIDAMRDE